MDEICKNCKYCEVETIDEDGLCFRYPPTYKEETGESEFPLVNLYLWCGEFKPK